MTKENPEVVWLVLRRAKSQSYFYTRCWRATSPLESTFTGMQAFLQQTAAFSFARSGGAKTRIRNCNPSSTPRDLTKDLSATDSTDADCQYTAERQGWGPGVEERCSTSSRAPNAQPDY